VGEQGGGEVETDGLAGQVGGVRAFARGMDGTQEGDPDKAARAVAQALEAETTPLRPIMATVSPGLTVKLTSTKTGLSNVL